MKKIQLKGFIVIIVLCVFSEVIFGAIMPSKEAARRNRRKSKNKAYYEAHKDNILLNKKENYSSEDRSQRHLDEYYKHVTGSCMNRGVAKGAHGWAFAQPCITVSCPTITNVYPTITSSLRFTRGFTAAHKTTLYFNTVKRKRVPHLLNHDLEEGIKIDDVSRDPLLVKSLGKFL